MMLTVVRTQVQLTEAQADALKRAAAERGTSMAGLIREAVDRTISQGEVPARRRRALGAVGAFASGLSDVSAEHDRYVVEAFSG